MVFRVSGKNIEIGEALSVRANARIAEAMRKFFDGGYSGHVTVAKDGYGFRTECAVHLDSGMTLHTDGMAADAYASVDEAALRIEKRLRRYKSRLKDHANARATAREEAANAASYVIAAPDHDGEDDFAAYNPVVIAEATSALETLSVRDAVLRLDMTGAPVVVFRHAVNGRINIAYRRADGNIGWVDPPASV